MKKTNFHAANTVLMFEGGGMRASYTSAMASLLLEQNITFGHVCGISAGSSNTVNFLSGDVWRTRASFTDFALEPEFGGAKSFIEGKACSRRIGFTKRRVCPMEPCLSTSKRLRTTPHLAPCRHSIAIRANRWCGTRKTCPRWKT